METSLGEVRRGLDGGLALMITSRPTLFKALYLYKALMLVS